MRCKSILAAAILSLATARADVVDDINDAAGEASSSVSSAVDSAASAASSSGPSRPQFTPTEIKAPLLEQFTDDWEDRWRVSHAKKESDGTTEEEWAYVGTWAVEEPKVLKGIEGDKGLVIKDKAAHHAISAKFAEPLTNEGKTLVAQYEVKLQNGLECGGAYMKLLQDNSALHAEEFSNASPYIIMFGPDKCGTTNKVHFIFRHKNPKTGEYEEKHLTSPPLARITKLTSLYTLIVRPDQTYEVRVDGNSIKSGSLFEDFNPPINPPEEIDDPDDVKPDDWVDNARIPDPDATKPDDWDEDAPFEIPDQEATKPDDWLEDEPLMIPDPEAEKPEDWDDEEDGDWIPPSIPNPKCEDASGCGPWSPPMVKNPDYKGKWEPPTIDNPEYKGIWKPQKIANPEFFEDKTPADFEPMGAIGFEIWTMQNDILFDNIYLGHSVEDAEKLANETYSMKRPIEKAEEDAAGPAKNKDDDPFTGLRFKDDPVAYIRDKVDLFVSIAKQDPVEAIKFVPEVAGGIGILAVTVIILLFGMVGGGGSGAKPPPKIFVKEPAEKAQDATAEDKNKAAEAVGSGAEKSSSEVNRRTTRSSAAVS